VLSIEFTATELENPFGDDDNDLPCHQFQEAMNSSLLVLLDPDANEPPSLNDKAILHYKKLIKAPCDMFGYGVEAVSDLDDPEAVQDVSSVAGSLEQELLAQVPQVQQQSQTLHEAGSLEAKRLGEATADEIGTKPSNLLVKVEPPNKAPVSGPVECRDLGKVPPTSDTKWHEKFAQDQQTAQQEMMQTLIGILERLDKPLSIFPASPLVNENKFSM